MQGGAESESTAGMNEVSETNDQRCRPGATVEAKARLLSFNAQEFGRGIVYQDRLDPDARHR